MKTKVLSTTQIEQKINRLAHQLYENNYNEKDIVVLGIVDRGYVLAKRIVKVLNEISDMKVHLGEVKVNKQDPMNGEITFSLENSELKDKVVFLVDDVINSGKTMIYVVNEILKVPVNKLRTLVLVDRKHNSYPIRADYVGVSLSTTLQEHVVVNLDEGRDVVELH
jgi:pyrimidine operon attenuation protein/uracil phosphoribosyltransferase